MTRRWKPIKFDDDYSVTIGRTKGKGSVMSITTGVTRQEIQLIRALLDAGMGVQAKIAGGVIVKCTTTKA